MSGKGILLASVAGAAIAGAAGQAAMAQGDAEEVTDRIVVTAQKREQSIIEVPINLTAMDEAMLDTLDIDRFDELSDFVPGLQIQLQSPNTPSFSIRGISTDSTASNVETRVSIFQDGVSASKAGGSVFELFDLERVEVAKGPQSTLFGRAALIGAINVITKKPASEFGAEGLFEAGEDAYGRLEAAVNIPLVEDRLAVRFAGLHTERDGYVKNLFEGRDLNARDTSALRGSLRFTPTDNLTVDLIANWQEDNPSGTSFKSGTIPTPGGDTSPFTPAALNTFNGFQNGRPLGVDRTLTSYTGIVSWDVSEAWTLTSVTGFRDFESAEIFDPDGSALEFIIADTATEGEQISQELRANFDNGGRLVGFAGVNYFREYGSRTNVFATNEAVAQQLNLDALLQVGGLPSVAAAEDVVARGLLTNVLVQGGFPPAAAAAMVAGLPLAAVNAQLAGLPFSPPLGPVDLDNPASPYPYSLFALLGGGIVPLGYYQEAITDSSETTAFDVFGDVTIHVTDRFDLTGGLRYTRDSKRATVYNTFYGQNGVAPTPTLLLPVTFSPVGVPGGPVTAEDEFDGLTWRLVGAYRVNDTTNVWASYARGRRPEVLNIASITIDPIPGPSGDEFSALAIPEVVPDEIVDSFEVGAYAEFLNGDLTVQGSVYYYTYQDFQLSFLSQGRAETINGGDASGPGVEAAVNWLASDFAEIFATYAYNGVRFDGGSGDTAGRGLDLDDARFRLAPDHSISLGARFSAPVGGIGEAYFIPSWAWRSEVLFENGDPDFTFAGGTLPLSQEGYGLVNLRLGIEDPDGAWSAELFARNAFDEEYIVDAGNTGLSFGSPTFVRGAPRLIGAKLTGRF